LSIGFKNAVTLGLIPGHFCARIEADKIVADLDVQETVIRELLKSFLVACRFRQQQRNAAQELREIADELEKLADVTEKSGRPIGTGARFLRWKILRGKEGVGRSGKLHVGSPLWEELGKPPRLNVQRIHGKLYLSPCGKNEGWLVTQEGDDMPRMRLEQTSADALGLTPGRYPAYIENGKIVTE
jgi:hypothetical protein